MWDTCNGGWMMAEKRVVKNVLVGATGSVAAIKIPELVKTLTECNVGSNQN